MRVIKYLVVHCSATRPDKDIGAKEIDYSHRVERGWDGIGYHYVIRRNGEIEEGREEEAIGAHVHGHNMHSIGICLIGGYDKDGKAAAEYMSEQWRSLVALLTDLTQRYPDATVMGHRDFPGVNKACPCFDVKTWWQSVSQQPKPNETNLGVRCPVCGYAA